MMYNIISKLISLIFILLLSTGMVNESTINVNSSTYFELLYDDVWGTIYNPVVEQCYDDPTITGDGSKIDINNASNHRWIAISQEMLSCDYRLNIINNPKINRFKGKIQYGDTVWIDSPHKNINGWWVVRDAKNVRYKNSIDFLQTTGDGSLYNNNPLWSGKFNNIKIYKIQKSYKFKQQKNDIGK